MTNRITLETEEYAATAIRITDKLAVHGLLADDSLVGDAEGDSIEKIVEVLNDLEDEQQQPPRPSRPRATSAQIARARHEYVGNNDHDIAIDDDAVVSVVELVTEDDTQSLGVWVSAWVWLEDAS